MPGFCVPDQQPDLTVQGLRANVQMLEDAVTFLQQQAGQVQNQLTESEARLKELSDHVYTNEHCLTEILEQMQNDSLGDVNPGKLRVGGRPRKKPLPALTVPESAQCQRETESTRQRAEQYV